MCRGISGGGRRGRCAGGRDRGDPARAASPVAALRLRGEAGPLGLQRDARPLLWPRADVQEQHGELLYVSTGVDNCWSMPPHAWHCPLQKSSCMRCAAGRRAGHLACGSTYTRVSSARPIACAEDVDAEAHQRDTGPAGMAASRAHCEQKGTQGRKPLSATQARAKDRAKVSPLPWCFLSRDA